MSIGYDKIRAAMPRFREKTNESLYGFEMTLRDEAMNLNPDYQRGHVWTSEQSENFVGHLLEGGASPAFVLHESRRGDWGYEMVDGQQRARAILAWFDGEIGARLSDNRLIWWKDADKVERRVLRMGITVQVNRGEWSRKERLDLYLKLNRGGTVHTDDEIARVRDLLTKETSP
jgi:hypothetical protein